jgi:anti-sigma factor RsiW
MNKCDEFMEILALGGDATPEEKAAAEAHAAECAECAALADAFAQAEGELAIVSEAPNGFADRVMDRLPLPKQERRESWTPMWVLSGAAYTLAAILGGSVGWLAFSNPAAISEAANAFTSFAASPGTMSPSAFGTIAGVSAVLVTVAGYFAYNLVLSAE